MHVEGRPVPRAPPRGDGRARRASPRPASAASSPTAPRRPPRSWPRRRRRRGVGVGPGREQRAPATGRVATGWPPGRRSAASTEPRWAPSEGGGEALGIVARAGRAAPSSHPRAPTATARAPAPSRATRSPRSRPPARRGGPSSSAGCGRRRSPCSSWENQPGSVPSRRHPHTATPARRAAPSTSRRCSIDLVVVAARARLQPGPVQRQPEVRRGPAGQQAQVVEVPVAKSAPEPVGTRPRLAPRDRGPTRAPPRGRGGRDPGAEPEVFGERHGEHPRPPIRGRRSGRRDQRAGVASARGPPLDARTSGTPAGTARRSASTSMPTRVLAEINDDLLYHGDLNAALRRMLNSGFQDRNGERVQGIKELMEKLRQQRRERLEQHDLGGVYDDIAEQLREVVDMERERARRPPAGGRRVGRRPPQGGHRRRGRPSAGCSSTCCRPTWPAWSRSCRVRLHVAARRGRSSRSSPTSSASSSPSGGSTRWPAP